jgi:hypothetical protein
MSRGRGAAMSGKTEGGPALKRERILWSRLLLARLPYSRSLSLPSLRHSPTFHGPSRNNGPTPLSKGDATVRKTQCPLWIHQHLKVPRLPQLRVCSPPPSRQPLLFLRLFPQAHKARRPRRSPRRSPQERIKWHSQRRPPSTERQRAHQA